MILPNATLAYHLICTAKTVTDILQATDITNLVLTVKLNNVRPTNGRWSS